MFKYIRAIKLRLNNLLNTVVFYFHNHKISSYGDQFFIQKFKHIQDKQYVRDDYILDLCKNKNVLHFGFIDHPIMLNKIENNGLLHLKIKKVSKYLCGIDVVEEDIKLYSTLAKDKDVFAYNLFTTDINETNKYFLLNNYDLILLPDVLEHVTNPGMMLTKLYELCKLNQSSLLVTVPNVYSSSNFMLALDGIEAIHPDHYYYYSPYTLKKILQDTGFKNIEIMFYNYSKSHHLGLTSAGVMALCSV